MCGQGWGNRVLWGALRSPIDLDDSSAEFADFPPGWAGEDILANASCSLSLRTSSAWVCFSRVSLWRSRLVSSSAVVSGEGLVTSVFLAFMAFKLVDSGRESGVLWTSPSGGKANSCGSNLGGFDVLPFVSWCSGKRSSLHSSSRQVAGKLWPLRPSQSKSEVRFLRLLRVFKVTLVVDMTCKITLLN